jgi:hypothetical protein
MPERFLNYWQQERCRLDQELQRAQAQCADHGKIAWLDRLRHIVDDQMARWSHDLMVDRVAA